MVWMAEAQAGPGAVSMMYWRAAQRLVSLPGWKEAQFQSGVIFPSSLL